MKINLGCGLKPIDGFVNVDSDISVSPDVCSDCVAFLERLPTSSVDFIYSRHFFEHVDDPRAILVEIERVLKPRSTCEIIVPHFSNPYYYSDPTHRTFFGLYTFAYFSDCDFRRAVPAYSRIKGLIMEDVRLNFRCDRCFPIWHVINRLFERLVNSCTFTKEVYERSFCWIFPCYEIKASLRKSV